jgi:hypothetical protein
MQSEMASDLEADEYLLDAADNDLIVITTFRYTINAILGC